MVVRRVIEKQDFVVLVLTGEITEDEFRDAAVWFNNYADGISSKITLMFVDDNFSMNMSAQRFVRVFALNPKLNLNLEFNTVKDYIFRSFLSVLHKFNQQYPYCSWTRNELSLTHRDLNTMRTLFLKVIELHKV